MPHLITHTKRKNGRWRGEDKEIEHQKEELGKSAPMSLSPKRNK